MSTSTSSAPPVPVPPAVRPASPACGSCVHLLPEPHGVAGGAPLVVPGGVSALSGAGGADLPRLSLPESGAAVLVEPLRFRDQLRLLVLAPAGTEFRHNDRLAAGLLLLRDGDQFAVDGGPALEMAVFNRPFVGAPPAEQVGVECPVCRLKLTAETRVFQCGFCSRLLHLEDGEDGLQCALVAADCSGCGQAIRLAEGYLTEPQFLAGPGE